MPSLGEVHGFAHWKNWRKETKKVIENLAKSSRRRENDTCSRYLRYSAFREAIRNDAITPDLISVKALDGYKLDLMFADGKCGVFDCAPYMDFEFMEDVREPLKFAAVRADHGTAAWPGGEDLCPDDLYANMISAR